MKSNLFSVLLCIIGIAALAACQSLAAVPESPGPKIINHAPPAVGEVDTAIFRQISSVKKENPVFYFKGDKNPLLAAVGCYRIGKYQDLPDALTPAYPIAWCIMRDADVPSFYTTGCRSEVAIQAVIYRDNQFERLSTLKDLQAVFAPIDSENEALSYALVATGLEAKYALDAKLDYGAELNPIEDTHIIKVDEGYRVNLYDFHYCGCGPHPTYQVDVLITMKGEIETSKPVYAFTDHGYDGTCVD